MGQKWIPSYDIPKQRVGLNFKHLRIIAAEKSWRKFEQNVWVKMKNKVCFIGSWPLIGPKKTSTVLYTETKCLLKFQAFAIKSCWEI